MKRAHGRRHFRFNVGFADEKIREGHPFTRRFRVVCKRCNGGWMSKIEDEAKPILIPLLQGQPKILLRNDRIRLATWITLKFLVAECIDQGDAVFDEFARADFMQTRKILPSVQIFIGTHDSPEWHIGYHRQAMVGYLGERAFDQS